jgi:signal transduction histidine kinase
MKRTPTNLPATAALLFFISILTILGVEFVILQLVQYNVYRVLDFPSQYFPLLLLVVMVQYMVFSRLPKWLEDLWQHWDDYKNQWLVLVACVILGSVIYYLLPFETPLLLMPALIGGMLVYSWLIYKLGEKPFYKIILLLIFGAGLNASYIFWLHEESNEGIHLAYARELAERRDTIAENELTQLVMLGKENPPDSASFIYWEKLWLDNPYLSSNYFIQLFESSIDSSASVIEYYKPLLTINENETPVFQIHFPNHHTLSFPLKVDFRRSVYTSNLPYKNLERLQDYQFSVVDHGIVVLSNTHNFDDGLFDVPLPPVGFNEKIEWNGFDLRVYRHSEEVYVLIGEPLSEVLIWISNFAFFFSLFIIAALICYLITLFWLRKRLRDFWQKMPIQTRIQGSLVSLTMLLFFVVAATTFIFLQQNNQKILLEREIYIAETLRKVIVSDMKLFNKKLSDFSVANLAKLAERKRSDIDVYNAEGELLVSSIACAANSPAFPTLSSEVMEKIRKNPTTVLVTKFRNKHRYCLKTIFSIVSNKKLEGFACLNSIEAEAGTAQDIPIIMSKLLNVYVFLLLLTWASGLLLINVLTEPLQLLAFRLSQFKPGQQNEKLSWEGDDAIGKLINEYNTMVDVVELATKELVRNEKEGAWQTMAQQISHEINNTLTPLRLNVQFLNRIVSSPDSIDPEKVEKINKSLIERIDHLSQVAAQFRLFAKLEIPVTEPVELKSFVQTFIHNYKGKEQYRYKVVNEIGDDFLPIVHIDIQHLEHVLTNLLAHAEEAIGARKDGQITIHVKRTNNQIVVVVQDNGNGMKAAEAEHIFDPKFSTTNSSSGLGLPICKRIVEFYQGDLKFVNQPGVGSAFQIIFPMEVGMMV